MICIDENWPVYPRCTTQVSYLPPNLFLLHLSNWIAVGDLNRKRILWSCDEASLSFKVFMNSL